MVETGTRGKKNYGIVTSIICFALPSNMLLAMYGIPSSTVTLFDIVLISCLLYVLAFEKKSVLRYAIPISFLIILIVIRTFLGFSDIFLMKVARFLLYLTFLLVLSPYFIYDRLITNTLRFAFIVSLYVILQAVLYNFYGINLPGHVNFEWLSVQRSELEDYANVSAGKSWFRPRGILGEPSQVGILVGFSLFFVRSLGLRFLFISALILSKSGTAIILFFVWIVYSLLARRIGRYVLLLSVLLVAVYLASEVEMIYSYLSKRFFNRFTSYQELFDLSSEMQLFFGHGLIGRSAFETWPNSLVLFIYYHGVIGLSVLLSFIVWAGKRHLKVLALVLLLATATELFVSQMLVFFGALLVSKFEQ